MNSFMKTENKLQGATNYRAWKSRIEIILARHKVLGIVLGKVTEPTDQAGKDKFQEDDILARSIIRESVREHLISYIIDHQTSKEMYATIT